MDSLNESILLSIECPACLEYMLSPIYVCVTGHSICNVCWNKLEVCPTCSMDLSETRNYSLETLTELLYYPCNNSEHGCKDTLKLSKMDDHLKICSFRIYKCEISRCSWEGRKCGIEDHFLNAHGDSIIVGPENWCWWNNTRRDVFLMLAYKEIFYVYRKILKNTMYWVVQYIGKSEHVQQYFFEISIFHGEQKNRKITISENCRDDLTSITEIIDTQYSVGIPIPVLENWRNRNGHVWYKISIKQSATE